MYLFPFSDKGGFYLTYIYVSCYDGIFVKEEYMVNGNQIIHELYKQQGKEVLFELVDYVIGGSHPLITSESGVFTENESNRVIADAKYKPIDNIGNKDYLQILAYMFRFDAKKGFYLYPESGDIQDLFLSLKKGTTYENNVATRDDIGIIKHGLKIPFVANDYADFSEKMKSEEERFITVLEEN